MHEERRKGGEREIGHGIGRVLPAPLVGQGLAVMAQRGDQAVLDLHPHVESEIALRANRENRVGGRSSGRGVAFATHPGRPIGRRIAAQTGESRSKAGLVAK
jgi:hypothetical protein